MAEKAAGGTKTLCRCRTQQKQDAKPIFHWGEWGKMRHVMLNMTDEISKKPGKCSISRSDAFEGMYKTCRAAIGADTMFEELYIHILCMH